MRSRWTAGKPLAIVCLAAAWAGCGEIPLGESAAAVAQVPITLSLSIDCKGGSGTLGTIALVQGVADYLDPVVTRVEFATVPATVGPVSCSPAGPVVVPLRPVRLPVGSSIVTLVPLGTSACDPSPIASLFDIAIASCSLSAASPSCAIHAVPLACVTF